MIEVRNVSKAFRSGFLNKTTFQAVKRVSFGVKDRELFGLLGPNGAGKTTLMQIMCTLALPDSGSVRINGLDAVRDLREVRRRINVVLEDKLLYEKLNMYENLDFFAKLYGAGTQERKKRVAELLKGLDIWQHRDKLVEDVSRGMRQRLAIARGLVNSPEVLFLDEPTSGLDPINALKARQFIKDITKREGITTVLTTHYMAEAEELCDRIAIMHEGRIVALDRLRGLKKLLKKEDVIEVAYSGILPASFRLKVPGMRNLIVEENKLRAHMTDAEANMHQLLDGLFKLGITIKGVKTISPTLEDVFVHLTGRRIEEESA